MTRMTRSSAREIAFHLVFELSFSNQIADEFLSSALTPETFARLVTEEPLYQEYPNAKQKGYITTLVRGVYEHREELDAFISRYAVGWKFSRLSHATVSILRICMYEVLYIKEVPLASAINEAIELAKRYEEDSMVPFINGILGSFVREEVHARSEAPQP